MSNSPKWRREATAALRGWRRHALEIGGFAPGAAMVGGWTTMDGNLPGTFLALAVSAALVAATLAAIRPGRNTPEVEIGPNIRLDPRRARHHAHRDTIILITGVIVGLFAGLDLWTLCALWFSRTAAGWTLWFWTGPTGPRTRSP